MKVFFLVLLFSATTRAEGTKSCGDALDLISIENEKTAVARTVRSVNDFIVDSFKVLKKDIVEDGVQNAILLKIEDYISEINRYMWQTNQDIAKKLQESDRQKSIDPRIPALFQSPKAGKFSESMARWLEHKTSTLLTYQRLIDRLQSYELKLNPYSSTAILEGWADDVTVARGRRQYFPKPAGAVLH